jgi:transcriptional regulator with XRE-family HTH domain
MESTPATPLAAEAEPANIASLRVASRLRQLRQDKGITLRELASAAGMSGAYLSRVENHQTAVTIDGLESLARALGVPMSVFFAEDQRHTLITVCRANEGPAGRLRGPRGFPYRLLAASKKGKLMEPLVINITPRSQCRTVRSHPGEEFNYVLEGDCSLTYGAQCITLHTGDAVYYDATVPHTVTVDRGGKCTLLSIVASRDYLFHGDLSKLLNDENC